PARRARLLPYAWHARRACRHTRRAPARGHVPAPAGRTRPRPPRDARAALRVRHDAGHRPPGRRSPARGPRRAGRRRMTGLLLVDKPEGTTSAGVIRALKPRLGRTKIGHLGTLDPFASGLLPLCLGEATKVARYLLLEDKRYTGTIRLGQAT